MKYMFSSPLSSESYVSALRQNMSSHIDFSERFTGFFLGKIFTVTHHSGYEWNRKISNVKNTALGYVVDTPDGCTVKFVRLKGMLAPTQFLMLLTMALAISLIVPLAKNQSIDLFPFFPVTGIVLTILIAPLETLMECMTEESEQGERYLLSLMLDPEHPYDHLHKI